MLLLRTNRLLLDRELMGGSSRQREKDDKALEQKSIEALVDVDPFHLAGTQGADYGVNDSLGGRLELS